MSVQSSWSLFHARIHQTIRQRGLLNRQERLLVAVSGGQDSLCLIRVLLDLQSRWDWTLGIVHCNHQWRSDAAANADYIGHLATEWEIPFWSKVAVNLNRTEAAARTWRYQVMTELALQEGYSAVLTGHTASDRAETLLYNLIRGSGTDGLQALVWQRELVHGVRLVRPLLDITRLETAQFCHEAGLTVWDDYTNADLSYARNRIRHELLPYLQTHFNPSIEKTLAQTAELLRTETDYWEQATRRLYQQAIASPGLPGSEPDASSVKLNRSVLRPAHPALQRRVMRQWLHDILPEAPTFEHVEKLVALVSAPNRSQTDPFPGGAIARVEGDWIAIIR